MAKKEVVVLNTKRYQDIDFKKYGLNVETNQEKILDKYEKSMKTEEILTLQFALLEQGDIYSFDEGVKIVMLRKDMDPFDRKFANDKVSKLNRSYIVKVKEVDRQNQVVYVQSAIDKQRNDLIKAIESGIKEETYITVPACVIAMSGNPTGSLLLINIGMFNIVGFIRINEWSPAFIKSFYHVTKIGDVIEVAVLRKANWKTGEIYECSRKQVVLSKEPWKGIKNKIPKKTNMRVLCTKKEKSFFYGIIVGLKDIGVMCNYPEGKHIEIVEGREYCGYVYQISEEKKSIRMRITGTGGNIDMDEEN